MKDIHRQNRPSGQPMAIRTIDAIEFTEPFNHLWIDRLVTHPYT